MKTTHKYRAKQVSDNGLKFHSKAEHKFYRDLLLLKKSGEVIFFLMQVPMHLTAGIKYYVDFVVFESNGEVRFIDVKGFETKEFKMKKKMVEALYPIEIEVIKV